MNKQGRAFHFEAGQAMELPRGGVLSAGEVRVQQPSRWLGGAVVIAPPVRVVAPALLSADSACTVVAVAASTVWVPDARPLPVSGLARSAWAWLRAMHARREGVPS